MEVFPTAALAGRQIEIDQGNNYDFSGQDWTGPDFITFNGAPGASTVTIPFQLNFGGGAQTYQFSFDAAGRAVLVAAGNGLTNYIAPLYLPGASFVPDPNVGGFVSFGRGQIDPQVLLPNYRDPNATYVRANALDVYRFVWNGVCNGGCNPADSSADLGFEAVLIDRKNGDFDLDFFYRNPQGAVPTGATGGFLLGAFAASFTSFNAPGPDYCFRGGALSTTCAAVAAVPEPSSVALLFLGHAMLRGVSKRRSLIKVARHA